jgi:hypothetical protein
MKRPPRMRTPDHTRSNLGQEKYYGPFIKNYIKILQYIANTNLVSKILTEITGFNVRYTKRTNNLANYIGRCEYALS